LSYKTKYKYLVILELFTPVKKWPKDLQIKVKLGEIPCVNNTKFKRAQFSH